MQNFGDKENVLSIIFESTHMMVAYLDTDLRFIQVNSAYAAVEDRNPDYFVGKAHFDLYPNEENEALFRGVIETGEPHFSYARPFEYEYHPDRGVTHWDWSLVPTTDDSGAVTGALLQLIDVTERIRAEEMLRIEQDFGSAVLASANALFVVLDNQGRIIRFNKACEQVTGYTFAEVHNRFVWDLLLESDEIEAVRGVFNDLADSAMPSQYANYWVARDGKKILIDWNNSVMKDEQGEVGFIVSVGIDITEKQHAIEELKRSEETMKSAQDAAHIGTWDWDITANRLTWSDEIYRIFGETRESFKSTFDHFLDCVHPEDRDRVKSTVETSLASPEARYRCDHRVVRKNGDIRFVKETGKVYFDQTGEPVRMIGIVQDDTENLNTTETLRNQAQIIDQIHDSVITTDLDGYIASWNKGAERIFGFSENEVIGKHISLVYPESKLEVLEKDVIAGLFEKGAHETESVMHRKNGEQFVGHLSLSFLTDEHGNRIRMIGYTMDISERKRVEEALRASEELMDGFFTQSIDGFFFMMLEKPIEWNDVADKDTLLDYVFSHQKMTKINRAMAQQYGGEVDQFIGLTPNDLFAHDIDYGKQLWRMMFDDGRLTIKTEEKKFDGTPMWIEGEYVCLYDDQGRIRGHFGVQREVTRQKLIEDEVRVSEARLNEAQRLAKVGSWELDLQTNHLYWTDEIYSLFEIDKKKFGASYEAFLDAIHPDDREAVNSAYTQSLEDRIPYVITHRLQMPDGRVKWVEERCSTVFADDGTPLISRGTVQDVTERKLSEEELEKYREKLEELVAERTRDLVIAQNELVRKERLATLGQLTATVSHELRNPLGAMRPSLYLVQRASDPDNDKLQLAIDRLDRNISRCDRIIDELLDFTRITVLERNDVVIDEWVQQVLEEQSVPAGIRIVRDFGLKDASAQVDANRLRRALINVIENGFQAMQDQNQPEEEKAIGELTIYTRDHGKEIEIGIRDTGVGIPEDVLPHIFEPLYSTKGFGVGLGMPTVQQIVNQHGGIINVDTVPGVGTTVRMTIPKQAETGMEALDS